MRFEQNHRRELVSLSPSPDRPQEPGAMTAKKPGPKASNRKHLNKATLQILEGGTRAIVTSSPENLSHSSKTLVSGSKDQSPRTPHQYRVEMDDATHRQPKHGVLVSRKPVHDPSEYRAVIPDIEDAASSCDSMIVHQDLGSSQQLPPRLNLAAVPAHGEHLTSWREAGVDLGRMPEDGYRRGTREGVLLN